MLRVSSLQFLLDLGIGRCPKTGQVAGQLLRPPIRTEQLNQQRHPAAHDPGRFSRAEQLLNADAHPWLVAALVVNRVLTPGGQPHRRRSKPVNRRHHLIAKQRCQPAVPIRLLQLGKANQPVAQVRQPSRQTLLIESWQRGRQTTAASLLVGIKPAEKPGSGQQTTRGRVICWPDSGSLLSGFFSKQPGGSCRISDRKRCLVEREIKPTLPPPSLHLFSRGIEHHVVGCPYPPSGECWIGEPLPFDRRRQPYLHLTRRIIDVNCQKPVRMADTAVSIEPNTTATDHPAPVG